MRAPWSRSSRRCAYVLSVTVADGLPELRSDEHDGPTVRDQSRGDAVAEVMG